MTPHGWQLVERYLDKLGDVFTHEADGILYQAVAEPGTGQYLVTPPGGEWAHRMEVMPAPDGNGVMWRVPTRDRRTALFPRTSEEAVALVAREYARSKAAVDVAGLASQARRLTMAIRAARDGADHHNEQVLLRRLDVAAERLDEAVLIAEDVAAALRRHADRPDRPCPARRGVCPEHGATLQRIARTSTRCRELGCGRVWPHDRYGEPCTEPASHRVRGPDGTWTDMCAGHVVALRGTENAHEWHVQPLTDGS